MLRLEDAFREEDLKRSVEELGRHHDALGLRFKRVEQGWEQSGGETNQPVLWHCIDLSELSDEQGKRLLNEAAEGVQRSLSLTAGPLMRVVLFRVGAEGARLLIVAHHLVIDGVSWRVLLEDLENVYEQLATEQQVKLPRRTSSWQEWSRGLSEYARSAGLEKEWGYWLERPWGKIKPLPVDYPQGQNSGESVENQSVTLTVEETQALLQLVPRIYQAQANEALLAAVAESFRKWSGRECLLVDLEGHGREEIIEGMDLSRTVGWFTTIYPVVLPAPGGRPGEALKAVKEELRAVPKNGIGYGLLKYLRPDDGRAAEFIKHPGAEVSFNYLGQFDQVFGKSSLIAVANESSGMTQGKGGDRKYLFEINGMIIGGRLRLTWSYSKNLHRSTTVKKLTDSFVAELQSLIQHCSTTQRPEYTPSDFPLAQLTQSELRKIVRTGK
jgi:non-ribosomal peptide synthase protein (TIGR01720 family)